MAKRIIQFGTSRFLQAHADLFIHEAREAGQDIAPITVVSMAETKCARWRRKSVPVWLIKKGCDALGSVCLL